MAAPRFHTPVALAPADVGREIALPDTLAHHAVRVLRLVAGDAITLFTGAGGEFAATIVRVDKRGATVRIAGFDPVERESPFVLTLAQAIAANDAMDYAVRKAVELGAAAIAPVVTARSAPLPAGARGDRRLAIVIEEAYLNGARFDSWEDQLRIDLWREALESRLARPVGFAMVDKRRIDGVVSSLRLVAGDVAGATVLLLDDLIASGDTMQRAAAALREAGAREVIAFAAHGLFVGQAAQTLADPAIDRVVITDSVPPFRLPADAAARAKLAVASAVPLFARAIRKSHTAWLR